MNTPSTDVAARAFIRMLNLACELVGEPWFRLPVATADPEVPGEAYRERVYCYELYHQLRRLSDSHAGAAAGAPVYMLSGEVDKAGLGAEALRTKKKPDLVWHVPGDSGHNAVVVEVKSSRNFSTDQVGKDLDTLAQFLSIDRHSYCVGVLLVYGDEDEQTLRLRVQTAARRGDIDLITDRLRLFWHRHVGTRPRILKDAFYVARGPDPNR